MEEVREEVKFCTSCQATKPMEGGMKKMTRGRPRWICRWCIAKAAPGPRSERRENEQG